MFVLKLSGIQMLLLLARYDERLNTEHSENYRTNFFISNHFNYDLKLYFILFFTFLFFILLFNIVIDIKRSFCVL